MTTLEDTKIEMRAVYKTILADSIEELLNGDDKSASALVDILKRKINEL